MLKNNLQKISFLFSIFPNFQFLPQNIRSKRMMWSKRCCGESCTFNNEKSFAFAICGKCVIKTFSVTIMS
jgi:hypothetical protein